MSNKKVFFYDAKPYGQKVFDEINQKYGFEINYFNGHLNSNTARLSQGHDAVCTFVNDTIDKDTVSILKQSEIGLIALRSAGYNNVDLKAVYENIHVVRVPAYSPHAVAEHAVALEFTLREQTVAEDEEEPPEPFSPVCNLKEFTHE